MPSAWQSGFARDTTTGALIVANPVADQGLPGIAAPSVFGITSITGALAAAVPRYGRFVAPRNMTITLAAFVLTTASSVDDPIEIGVYDSAGTLVATSGPAQGKTNGGTGVKTVPLAATLVGGQVYYVGVVQATIGGTAAQLQTISAPSGSTSQLFGSNVPNGLLGLGAGAALPGSIAALTFNAGSCPLVALREV